MSRTWITSGRLRRALPGVVATAAATVTALAGAAGPAAAAQHQAAAAQHQAGAAQHQAGALAGQVAPATRAAKTGAAPISGEPLRGQATKLALASNCAVTFARGDLYIADGIAIRKVGPQDFLTTIHDQGYICGLAVDHWGNIVFANADSYKVQVLAEKTGNFYGQAMTAKHVYTVAGTGHEGINTNGTVATQADLGGPYDVVIDRNGNLVFADSGFKHQATTGTKRHYGAVIQVVAVKTGTFYHHKMTAGDLYTVAGHWGGPGDAGEGGLATKASLGRHIGALALDKSGDIVIAASYDSRVEFVAEKSGTYFGQAMTGDHIYSVAGTGALGYSGDGGPGTSAEFNQPWGVTVDGSGNLVIADFYNNRVRVLAAGSGTFYGQPMTVGDVYTVVGTGTGGFSGDGGPAANAEINWPVSVSMTPSGGLVVDDYNNQRDRFVPASTGTFFGQSMTAGNIYTIAGNGQYKQ